jgi:hypothetical protein
MKMTSRSKEASSGHFAICFVHSLPEIPLDRFVKVPPPFKLLWSQSSATGKTVAFSSKTARSFTQELVVVWQL